MASLARQAFSLNPSMHPGGLYTLTGERDKFPAERDKNTSDRDVYPDHVFALTGQRDKNTADWDAFLGVFWCDRDPKKC